MNDTGWRGSPEIWLETAYESLLTSGIGSVRIQLLAEKLKLSRTSFYWFFKDRDALLDALLDRWRTKNTQNLMKQMSAYAETIVEAMFNVTDCWLDPALFDSQFEYAVRGWALQSPPLADEIGQTDERRIVAMREMFLRFGFEHEDADVRARTTYLNQIGYITTNTKETLELRIERMPQFVRIYTGQVPQRHEIDRFFSRHGFSPDPK